MSIISTFKSFERYIKVVTDTGIDFQLTSERTAAKDIIFDNQKNLENVLKGYSIEVLSESDYNALSTKDSSVIYLTY